MKPRLRGLELQHAFDAVARDCLATPSHLCMTCKKPSAQPFVEIDAIFGDLQRECETGTLEVNGHFKIRICRKCSAGLQAMHEQHGVLPRIV